MSLETDIVMAKLLVEVVSRETIRPSSATPCHLRRFQLSLIDQVVPDYYIGVLSFFPKDDEAPAKDKAALLKSSLSETVNRIYPLAGRVAGGVLTADAHVDCNDAGVEFLEARVEGDLEEVLRRPPMRKLSALMPNGGTSYRSGDPILAVQLNTFPCGGMALGVCITHRAADATSVGMFLSCWANLCRGQEPPVLCLNSATVLPPADVPRGYEPCTAAGRHPWRMAIRSAAMTELRKEIGGATRFEAAVALLWRAIARRRWHPAKKGQFIALLPVSLRGRMDGFSPQSFGNVLIQAVAVSANPAAAAGGLAEVGMSVRKAVRTVNTDYVLEQTKIVGSGKPFKGEDDSADVMGFSSWCRMGMDKTDFGWGPPAWYCPTFTDEDDFVVFGDSDGAGLDAWVWLPLEEMEGLREDPELLRFVDPSSFSY